MSQSKELSREERTAKEAKFFQSPWSDETRKMKSSLLVASLVGLIAAAVGIFPREISAFGLKVVDIDEQAFLVILSLVILYLTINYSLSVYSDIMHGYWDELTKIEFHKLPEDEIARDLFLDIQKVKGKVRRVHEIHILFDIIVPIIVGITSIIWLFIRSANL